MAATSKLQTLEQAKASAPKPRGPMLGPEKSTTTLTKPAGKIASKVAEAKSAVKSSTAGRTIKAAKAAAKPIAEAASKTKTGKVLKTTKNLANSKFVKRAAGVALAAGEGSAIVSGQAEKDFRRIQALENRIAAAKGQKPKYTKSGSKRNLGESLKVDAANILSFAGLGKSRKARLEELKNMATKVGARTPGPKGGGVSEPPQGKKPTLTKGSNAPAATSGNKYRVQSGDTLSGIASRAGVSLKDLRASNPQITDPRKIYRNTGVVIPKSGKVPTGGYTKKAK
jgi:LysM repeat protein